MPEMMEEMEEAAEAPERELDAEDMAIQSLRSKVEQLGRMHSKAKLLKLRGASAEEVSRPFMDEESDEAFLSRLKK